MASMIEIFELISYIDGGTRPFEEGSRIVNANHVLLCGHSGVKQNPQTDKYFALCLQTSSLSAYPHEINIEISDVNKKKKIIAHCTCKAGNSGKCKHIVGVLLILNRNTKDSVEKLGCTDLRQQWGQIKEKVNTAYVAEPFYQFCHGEQFPSKHNTKSFELKQEIFRILCSNDESELGQHTKMYRSSIIQKKQTSQLPKRVLKNLCKNKEVGNNNVRPIYDLNALYAIKNLEEIENIMNQVLQYSIWNSHLTDFSLKINSKEEAIFYNTQVAVNKEKAKDIMFSTLKQNNDAWHLERSKRITGSISYQIYTYMKNKHTQQEWDVKVNSLLKPKFKGNANTLRGKESEGKAKEAYEKMTAQKVVELGLMVLPTSPWFGYSADGMTKIKDQDKHILLEFKCPNNEHKLNTEELVKSLRYIVTNENKRTLKKHHPYYGQIQLGMCLYNLNMCHFVIYNYVNDTCEIIAVERDDVFLSSFIKTLSESYFTFILPWLMKNNSKENCKKID